MGMASISVETHFQEYNLYSGTIRQQPDTPNRKGARGAGSSSHLDFWGQAA
jgi:hypothetical protein